MVHRFHKGNCYGANAQFDACVFILLNAHFCMSAKNLFLIFSMDTLKIKKKNKCINLSFIYTILFGLLLMGSCSSVSMEVYTVLSLAKSYDNISSKFSLFSFTLTVPGCHNKALHLGAHFLFEFRSSEKLTSGKWKKKTIPQQRLKIKSSSDCKTYLFAGTVPTVIPRFPQSPV